METLGSDLVLLSLHPKRGRVRWLEYLRYGVMGSELVRLAASGDIDIRDGRIVVADPECGPTGDQDLDAALASIAKARRPPRTAGWVGRPRRRIVDSYLARLAAAGVIEPVGEGRRVRWRIIDQATVSAARARLDEIALGSGPVDMAQAAYAGLAHAARLDQSLYPGRKNRAVRKRCLRLGRGQWTAPDPGTGTASPDVQQAAIRASTEAAIRAAVAAAARAATAASM